MFESCTADLCPGCFDASRGDAPRAVCGFDAAVTRAPNVLRPGTLLHGQFIIGRLLGRLLGRPGGFGITYLGFDRHLETRVAIKEYLPRALAVRAADAATIVAHSADEPKRLRHSAQRRNACVRCVQRWRPPQLSCAPRPRRESASPPSAALPKQRPSLPSPVSTRPRRRACADCASSVGRRSVQVNTPATILLRCGALVAELVKRTACGEARAGGGGAVRSPAGGRTPYFGQTLAALPGREWIYLCFPPHCGLSWAFARPHAPRRDAHAPRCGAHQPRT